MSLKEFFDNAADFFPNFIMFFLQFFIFYQKKEKISVIPYALIFGKNMHKGLIFFSIFVSNKIFKIIFTKRNFIRYYYLINIYRFIILMKSVFFNFSIIKFYNFFYPFLYLVLKFLIIFLIHSFPLFSLI